MDLLRERLTPILLWGATLVTVLIVPSSYDPISAPKMALTVAIASVLLIIYSTSSHKVNKKNLYAIDFVLIAFVLLLLLNVLVNNSAITERIFGISGRSTGLLTFLSFAIILFISQRVLVNLKKLFMALIAANIVVSFYFLAQVFGFDFGKFQEYYGAPSSTLGNPNFVAGFLGFSALSVLGVAQSSKKKLMPKILISALVFLNLWVIYRSDSVQGLIAIGVSFTIYSLFFVHSNFSVHVFRVVLALITGLALVVLLGFFGVGPLALFLSSTTVFSRLDYWRAATAMTLESPLFGQGLDSFGDNYRRFRDLDAIARFGEGQVTDSAHNVYLDFFAAGGFPLGILFILLNLIPVYYLIKKCFANGRVEKADVILFGLWAGFQVQTLVSVNQIGVSIWIWIILGAIVARSHVLESKDEHRQHPREDASRSLVQLLVISVSLLMTGLSLLPVKSNLEFLARANNADGLSLKRVALGFPQDSRLIAMVAQGFKDSGYSVESLDIVKQGIEHNSESFLLWKMLYENIDASELEKSQARSQMLRLDPRYVFPSQ
jgi:O-antigen ligase